jgi:hypothetical protein
MRFNRKYVAAAAVAATLATGTGIALATAGDDDAGEQVSGPAAAKARGAALAVTGGGTANAVERDDEDGATWEVEVIRPDGQTVDVRLDEQLDPVAVEGDSEEADDDD